jgi:exonuclease VII large subunit
MTDKLTYQQLEDRVNELEKELTWQTHLAESASIERDLAVEENRRLISDWASSRTNQPVTVRFNDGRPTVSGKRNPHI